MIEIKKFKLSSEEFNKLRKLVFDTSGISLSDSKRELVISRFSRRLRSLNLDSFSDYYNVLVSQRGASEIQNFINSITTNKTDFFREAHHFDFIKDSFVSEMKNRKSEVRVWSAACSTGEEPYTIAMVLHKYLVEPYNIPVKIMATDIDTTVLEAARKGIYEERMISPIPKSYLKKYFLKGKDESSGLFKVKDVVKDMVTFMHLNFINKDYSIHTKFDIIFCRNVIIYFNNETKRYVINKLNDYLRHGGYFVIGHSETLFDMVDGLRYLTNTIYKKDY